jgi:CBS domain-containing protein
LPATRELCHRPAPAVDERASRAHAADVMQKSNTDALVVYSGNRVVGVLTVLSRSIAQEPSEDQLSGG